jgi:hypothetical protein
MEKEGQNIHPPREFGHLQVGGKKKGAAHR